MAPYAICAPERSKTSPALLLCREPAQRMRRHTHSAAVHTQLGKIVWIRRVRAAHALTKWQQKCMLQTYSSKRKCISLKRQACLFLAFLCLFFTSWSAASAEDTFHFDTTREIAAYLDEAGVKYTVLEGSDSVDVLAAAYTPATSKELEQIVVQIYAYEASASIRVGPALQPDTSDMLQLYQNLESVNDSVSFVRFIYNTQNGSIYPCIEIPYVKDAEFGHMVERNMYIAALIMDQHYDELVAMFQ